MRFVTLALSALLLGAAPSGFDASSWTPLPLSTLEGAWVLEGELGARFRVEGDSISGHDGCNGYGGTLSWDPGAPDSAPQLGGVDIRGTLRACPDLDPATPFGAVLSVDAVAAVVRDANGTERRWVRQSPAFAGLLDPSMGQAVPFLTRVRQVEIARHAMLVTRTVSLEFDRGCVVAVGETGERALLSLPELDTLWDPDTQTIHVGEATQAVPAPPLTYSVANYAEADSTTPAALRERLEACGVSHVLAVDGLGVDPDAFRQSRWSAPELYHTKQRPLRADRVRSEQLCEVAPYPFTGPILSSGLSSKFDFHGTAGPDGPEVYYQSLSDLRCAPDGEGTLCRGLESQFPLVIRKGSDYRAARPRSRHPVSVRIAGPGTDMDMTCAPAALPIAAYTHPTLQLFADPAAPRDRADPDTPEPAMWRARGVVRDDGCLVLTGEGGEERIAVWSDPGVRRDVKTGEFGSSYSTAIGDMRFSGALSDWRGHAQDFAVLGEVCGTTRGFVLPRLLVR